MPYKIFGTQSFFANHFKHQTVNKATRREPSVNPRQLFARYLKKFSTAILFFNAIFDEGFLMYFPKYFLSLLNSPNVIF